MADKDFVKTLIVGIDDGFGADGLHFGCRAQKCNQSEVLVHAG
jgi:hypothetical protein